MAQWLRSIMVIVMATPAMAQTVSAQSPPPAGGTMALEGTMKTFYKALNVFIVTTVDGVEHAYHFSKDLVVHGGKGAGVDALEGLSEGSTVVVHYAAEPTGQAVEEIDVISDDRFQVTEGVAMNVDRRRQEITVRYGSGRTETFRLTHSAAAEAATDTAANVGTEVMIYYTDERGQKVAHYFRLLTKQDRPE